MTAHYVGRDTSGRILVAFDHAAMEHLFSDNISCKYTPMAPGTRLCPHEKILKASEAFTVFEAMQRITSVSKVA